MSLELLKNLDLDRCTAFAKHKLTRRRFQHSVGVMQVINELASIYDLDPVTARICGILHDAAKELSVEEQLELLKKSNIPLSTPCDEYPLFLHGPAGACYITQELGIQNIIVLDTISRHSYFGTGVAVSPVFCWCLRFADMLEPGRDWKELKTQLGPLVYSGRIKEGAYLLTEWMIPFLETKFIPVHPNLHRILNELSTSIREEDFFEANQLPV